MENVAQLLENLLAWTSPQIRREQLELENFDIHKILIQQKQLLDRISKEKNINIALKDDHRVSTVNGDKNMIELVTRNLINNAIKFSKADGVINISTLLKEGFIKICFEDYGKGIPKENLEKINSGVSFITKGANIGSGTGLGLVLVREYISKNSGRLEVISSENHGTKFCIYIPKGIKKSV